MEDTSFTGGAASQVVPSDPLLKHTDAVGTVTDKKLWKYNLIAFILHLVQGTLMLVVSAVPRSRALCAAPLLPLTFPCVPVFSFFGGGCEHVGGERERALLLATATTTLITHSNVAFPSARFGRVVRVHMRVRACVCE
jgi:hypothetical protein